MHMGCMMQHTGTAARIRKAGHLDLDLDPCLDLETAQRQSGVVIQITHSDLHRDYLIYKVADQF